MIVKRREVHGWTPTLILMVSAQEYIEGDWMIGDGYDERCFLVFGSRANEALDLADHCLVVAVFHFFQCLLLDFFRVFS